MKIAHSAPTPEREPQLYSDHVTGAKRGAIAAAAAMRPYLRDPDRSSAFVRIVADAAEFHDLGKLDADNQAALILGRSGRLRWDHIDAGVAYLMANRAECAAWLVRAHHAPGLPSKAEHFSTIVEGLKLRGRRREGDRDEHRRQIVHTDRTLADLLRSHVAEIGAHAPRAKGAIHGLFLRIALSCLVDGDHGDSAFYETGWRPPSPPASRWHERLAQLDAYVEGLNSGQGRDADRAVFYRACREGSDEPAMATCEGPVGIGKTTAVLAWMLRRAIRSEARRIIIVAPYTTILSQTADRVREAVVLDGENADEVVAEHHHRADFSALASRDLATLWQAPIVLTTSVQFFETLSACEPSRLRKLHAMPGSVICLDEAHAALPATHWKQNWAWMQELTRDWGCSFVFASGSLAKVWEQSDLVDAKRVCGLPDLVPRDLQERLTRREHDRVRYRTVDLLKKPNDIISTILETPGPRLVVLNTVQTAAVIASKLNETSDTLHLSTALCPRDRSKILVEVLRRLAPDSTYPRDWTLVATSLVEAGIDISFRTALRERFSTSSLIQIGGRVNRHGLDGVGEVIDFFFDRGVFEEGHLLTHHPAARQPADVLSRLFARGTLAAAFDPAEIVTQALVSEIRGKSGTVGDDLAKAERDGNYPEVARLGRLIADETQLVVVKADLRGRLERKEHVPARELLAGSVQLRASKIDWFSLQPLQHRPDILWWPHAYDPSFLGYMKGAMTFVTGEAYLV